MFKKLLLAVTITFSLNLFLEARLPSETTTASRSQTHLAEMPTKLVKVAKACDYEHIRKLVLTLREVQAKFEF